MSLNCLRRIDSEEDVRDNNRLDEDSNKPNFKFLLGKVERSWSGNLAPDFRPKPNFKKMRSRSSLGTVNKPKKTPPPLHWVHNSGPASFESAPPTPRLVRSSGMRRDWSFEDVGRVFNG